MAAKELQQGGVRANLYSATITAAISAVGQTPVTGMPGARHLSIEAQFTYGSGGTSADAWVQTSIDGGVTWFDIANFHFTTATAKKISTVVLDPATPLTAGTTPGTGALAANTVLNGILGDRFRALITTVGTYGGATTLTVDMVVKA